MELTAKLRIKPGQTVAAVGMPDGMAPLADGADPAAEPGEPAGRDRRDVAGAALPPGLTGA